MTPKDERLVLRLDLIGHKDCATYKCKSNVRAGAPDLSEDVLAEVGLDEIGEEFFCRNFLLMFTALNFFGCGAERPVELVEPDATAVMIVGRGLSDCTERISVPSVTFSTASMVSGTLCGTVVDVTSSLTSSDPTPPESSLLVESDSPGVSVPIFAIYAS